MTSKRPSVPVAASGIRAWVTSTGRPKNSSMGRPLQVMVPVPGVMVTRATEVLRLPVAR